MKGFYISLEKMCVIKYNILSLAINLRLLSKDPRIFHVMLISHLHHYSNKGVILYFFNNKYYNLLMHCIKYQVHKRSYIKLAIESI